MSSPYIQESLEILDKVKDHPLSIQERKKLTIELAALMLQEASHSMTASERRVQKKLARLMYDPVGKAFTTAMTDQCFRSHTYKRVADQMIYLLTKMGVPEYLGWFQKMGLLMFKSLGAGVARFLVPFATYTLRQETKRVILPGEPHLLKHHLEERKKEHVQINLNHLGEAIISEFEAKKRMQSYLDDLKNPDINYISIKISTIFSQINLVDFEGTINHLAARLKHLYRATMLYPTTAPDGSQKPKFINLDMEEYRDLQLTVAAFKQVLNEPEFQEYSAGIVLQAYLPDSFPIQQELTNWAKARVKNGGAPIKIRIVKGANLGMEQFEASLKGWPQAPYTNKIEVDANYKRMVIYGCVQENARAVRLGIATHNLFDIAFAMLLRQENGVQPYVGFEMLEGMADATRRVVQSLTGDILLYCPVAAKKDFEHAIAYLIRRLDENTGAENFLRHVFGLKPGTDAWETQTALFSESCDQIQSASQEPRRVQNRFTAILPPNTTGAFENEPDTDFALPQNQKWAEEITSSWKARHMTPLPIVIEKQEVFANQNGAGYSPSDPQKVLFSYAKADAEHLEKALCAAKQAEMKWGKTTPEHRSQLLARTAQLLRERRGELIGAMMMEGGKIITESDPEVSEAIDFCEYYRRQIIKFTSFKDIGWTPKGTILVTPPWNFPCAIPTGGISAALAAGNCVLFKPASQAVLTGWYVVNAFWDAGVPKDALQFIPCSGEEIGSFLIQDSRVNAVILTGGTATALSFLKLRPDLDLSAETGGKNSVIITALADRDLAIKNLIHSAFGHSGQKCSAASLAILEKEIYEDPHFKTSLKNAAASLKVGPAWELATKVNPLIHPPKGVLKQALTSLEPGEEWLLEPKQDLENPALWSPGIKWNVKPGSFTHMNEFFGPVLGIMKAQNLEHAIHLANMVPYGLTSGLESLDLREQEIWIEKIEAGNLYINRGTTGAIVKRQPFGGTKASNFGSGFKAGGPNYLRELMHATQIGIPQEKLPVNESVNQLTTFLERIDLSAEQLGLWIASISNYAYWWKRMRQERDPTKIVGQDNYLRYVPRHKIALRLNHHSHPQDALRVIAAALTCGAELAISWTNHSSKKEFHWSDLSSILQVIEESEEEFIHRIKAHHIQRVRMVEQAPYSIHAAAAITGIHVIDAPVLANGRLELLNYIREVAISIDYHRYGNLGLRESEVRKQIL